MGLRPRPPNPVGGTNRRIKLLPGVEPSSTPTSAAGRLQSDPRSASERPQTSNATCCGDHAWCGALLALSIPWAPAAQWAAPIPGAVATMWAVAAIHGLRQSHGLRRSLGASPHIAPASRCTGSRPFGFHAWLCCAKSQGGKARAGANKNEHIPERGQNDDKGETVAHARGSCCILATRVEQRYCHGCGAPSFGRNHFEFRPRTGPLRCNEVVAQWEESIVLTAGEGASRRIVPRRPCGLCAWLCSTKSRGPIGAERRGKT